MQLHPKKNTKICYVQYRLRAVSISSHLFRGVPLSSRVVSHARGHLRLSRVLLDGPMPEVYGQYYVDIRFFIASKWRYNLFYLQPYFPALFIY